MKKETAGDRAVRLINLSDALDLEVLEVLV